MAISTQDRAEILRVVVGMFNGAPGATILSQLTTAFEAGSSLQDIATNLAQTAEYQSLYPDNNTNQETATKIVDSILGNFASADVKADAVDLLTGMLNSKNTSTPAAKAAARAEVTVWALNALKDVSEDDAALGAAVKALNNKVEVAKYFSVDSNQDPANLQAAQNVLADVDDTDASVDAAKDSIDGTTNEGETFTLTTSIDNIVGTSGNDTVIGGSGSAAGASTLGSADVINGGAGTDTMKITTEGAAAVAVTPNLTSMEKVEVQALTTAVGTTVNMVNATGTTEIWNVRSTDALTVTNVQEAATVGLKGNVGANAYRVGFKDSLASGTADSVNIALEDAVTTGGLGFGGMTPANEFETINIAATGTNSISQLQQSGGAALAATKTVNVTGAGKVTVTNALAATVTSVDASANTGGVSFDLTATGAVTAKGGSGADTFKMGATLTTADVLTGGDGTDIIGVTTGASLVTGLQVTGFETLDIGGADNQTGANAYDMSKLAGITTLKVGAALNGTAAGQTTTVNNLAKGANVEINAAVGNAAADVLAINVKDSGAGSPNDVIDLLVKGAVAFATTGDIQVKDIETVNLTADKSVATGAVTHTITKLTANQALTVAVKDGSAALTITDLDATSLVLFDATAATQAVSLTTGADAYTGTNGVAFKLGAGADTLVLTGATTAGGDFFITGGAGGDKITLTANNGDATADAGEEIEVLVYTAAADSQVGKTAAGATKYDVITNFDTTGAVATAFDKIDLKALNIASGQQSVFVKAPGTAITDSGEVAAADQLNFFVNAGSKNGVAVVNAADVDGNTAAAQAGVFVYVDANGDGNFSAADDMVIALVGATAADIGANTFVFA